jgi:hypothetical protein
MKMQSQLQHLSFDMKQNLLGNFPNIKLCYDNIIHNKVEKLTNIDYDICSAIPCGKKCFAWFTQVNDKNVCLILELIDRKNIHDIKMYNCVFNNELVYGNYGTILYGTLFHYNQSPFFAVEDIFYCKGNEVGGGKWGNKLCTLKNLFDNDIKQVAYNKNFIVFGLPLMADNIDELKRMIGDDIKYKIYNIQFRSFNKANVLNSVLLRGIDSIVKAVDPISVAPALIPMHKPKQETILPNNVTKTVTKPMTRDIIFKIKADIQNDIYHLYCIENNVEIFYNVAYIPDYKTSVMMNKLFRNIKENENLDLLEESDDEDEFQNENIDRFVDINKSYLMICKFNHKFKKWYPVKEYSDQNKNALIIEKHLVADYEKNNYVPHQQRQQYEKKHYNNVRNNTNNTKIKKSYYRK